MDLTFDIFPLSSLVLQAVLLKHLLHLKMCVIIVIFIINKINHLIFEALVLFSNLSMDELREGRKWGSTGGGESGGHLRHFPQSISILVILGGLFKCFFIQLVFVQLLDYSFLLNARHDELIHESITLDNHNLILRLTEIMRSQLKNLRNIFSPTSGI